MKTNGLDFLDDQVFALMWKSIAKEKGYASYWDWPDKATKELGVVRDLLGAIKAKEGQHGIRTLSCNKTDPPDCIGIGLNGEQIGFEVTELVDQATVEHNKHGHFDWKEWKSAELQAELASRLQDKDGKQLQNGPFERYIVVIYTDEPLLRCEDCADILRGHRFGPFQQIDEAFLLFSPEPSPNPGKLTSIYVRLQVS